VTILKAALNMAFQDGRLHEDKEWRRLKPLKVEAARREGFLSVEQSQRLINAANAEPGFGDLVHGALLTGCRYAELCRLTVGIFSTVALPFSSQRPAKHGACGLLRKGWGS